MNLIPLLTVISLTAWADSASTTIPAAPESFAYVLQADAFAKGKPAAVTRFAACERDWLVLDATAVCMHVDYYLLNNYKCFT